MKLTERMVERWQRAGIVTLIGGIVLTAIVPGPGEQGRLSAGGGSGQMFYLAEKDYVTHFLGSYIETRGLPFETESFASYAGYETHKGQFAFEERRGLLGVANYAGDLLEVAEIRFRARDERVEESRVNRVYLTDSFSRRIGLAEGEAAGREIMVDGRWCVVAGVTEDPQDYFTGIEVWVPRRSSEPVARADSLQLVGKLREGVSWEEASAELAALARRGPAAYRELLYCKLVPAEGAERLGSRAWGPGSKMNAGFGS